MELQDELNRLAINLTKDYNLQNQIYHINADILEHDFLNLKFDSIVSWLALYHILSRKKLLNKIYNLLEDDGFFYSEDFFINARLNDKDKKLLKKSFHANYLVDFNRYINDLKTANFRILYTKDMTEDWKRFTLERYEGYKINLERHIKINGKQAASSVLAFYKLAYTLLSKNIIGGIKFACKK